MSNYDWLIERLDAFIRKYYANQVIRGTLVFLICLLCYILTVSVSEYFLYMPVWLRVSVVSAFVLLGGAALVIWIIIPLTRMAKLGKVISHEQAATIIGKHFPEVSDRLLNILQLKKNADTHASRELIEASIDQKAKQISVVPIVSAIDYSKNRKFLKYLLPLLLIGVFILVAAPNVFRDASERLLQPTKEFEKPAPFRFVIQSNPLKVVRNGDYTLKVQTTGDALPASMSVEIGSDKMLMQSKEQHIFQYTFRNVTEPVKFKLYAAGFYSHTYTLQVVPKPMMKAFKVQLDYPDYTGKKDEVRESLGDMTIPAGTKVTWAFVTEYTDAVTLHFGDGSPFKLPKNGPMFGYRYRFMNDTSYTFALHNSQSPYVDSYRYNVQVIPDQYPTIQLQKHTDTVTGTQVLLNGIAGDDYGVSKVVFHYDISNEDNDKIDHKSEAIKATPGVLTTFQYYFDIGSLNLLPGQKLSYYVEVWDNDGVHGSKATRSEVMTYNMYNKTQLDSAINANSQQINSAISNSAQRTERLQSEYNDIKSKVFNSDKLNWEQQQSIQEMMKKQMDLQNEIENIKKRFEEQKQQSQQKDLSQDIKDKQDQVEKQLDNLLNNELKEQMKKLQDLMKRLNKDNAFQTMQQMQEDNKLFNMDLKRVQELMKKLEMQMRMEDMANQMDSLAKQERDLKSKTLEGKTDNKALAQDQKDIKSKLDKAMQQSLKQMQELNNKMEQKQPLQGTQSKGQHAQQNMQQSQQQLEQSQNSNATQSEDKAAQNLDDMASSLRKMASGTDMQELKMKIRAVRQILTNLIRLSFDQEDLMDKVPNTSVASQAYLANMQEQNRLHENSLMIRDSLYVLSRKMFTLTATINKETQGLEQNMKYAAEALEDRRLGEAATRQQYVMTHTNNLALMLNEVLSNLLQMQSQAMKQKGNGSCNKPGGMRPKPGPGQQLSDIITQQQQMGKSMQQMEKEGNKSSEQGKQNSQSEYGNAEQLARLAEQQAAIRRQLRELNSLLNSKGLSNSSRELQEIQKEMDKTETDLVNKRLNSELLRRQKEILTRLLQAENSIREQEQDNKRQSHTAKNISRPIPPELQKYIQDREHLLELYKTVPPQLKPYYRSMVEEYYQMIGHK